MNPKHRLFRLADWPWGLMVLAGAVAIGASIVVPNAEFGLRLTGLLAGFAFWGITLRRYVDRHHWLRGIVGYTSQGVGVWLDAGIEHDTLAKVDAEVERALNFWSRQFPKAAGDMRLRLKDVLVEVFDVEFIQAKHGGRDVGVTVGDRIGIAWAPGQEWAVVGSIVRHEMGHFFMNCAGVFPDEEERHHDLMRELGAP